MSAGLICIGNSPFDTDINRCYAANEMESENCFGICSDLCFAINTFWDLQLSNCYFSYGGSPKTTAQMKDVRTFTDAAWSNGLDSPWDFVGNPYDDTGNNDYWDIDPSINDGYPYLTWQDLPIPPAPINVTIIIAGDDVELNWDDMGVSSYNIYRSIDPYTENWGDAYDSSAVNSYTDIDGAVGTKYFYYVTACD